MAKKLLVVFGTRPEVIKLAPVIAALRTRPNLFETIVCSSGQHREMLAQALGTFGIKPDIDLDVMQADQTLPGLTAQLVTGLSETIVKTHPNRVIVQGDTTTAFAAALAAYYAHVPVAHVEAGLRSHDRYNPFPEEINRRLISAIADIHFAPTERAAVALASEGISPTSVHFTGNTIVDALLMLKARLGTPEGIGLVSPFIRAFGKDERPIILATCHRRENFGEDLAAICRALKRIALAHPDHRIVFPVHLNPNVRTQVMPILTGTPNIALLEPVSYPELVYLLSRAVLILSDSGGIQEETPSFGVPVLVLRKTTERPEGIEAGIAELVGADEQLIFDRTSHLLSQFGKQDRIKVANPYGDGRASERIVEILAQTP
jgi:UDP-N-acetylglucosamine 2-epimerase (non-hydrolysing)